MRTTQFWTPILATLGLMFGAMAPAADRGPGWEFQTDLIYQLGQDIDFNGGSSASLDDDFGLMLAVAYRFNERLELSGGIDWQDVDYDVNLVTDPGRANFKGHGSLESFTPRVALNFNLVDGPLTPYVRAGIGWSFIDTNIPEGRPQNVCWWDPWWGYVCGTVQDSRSVDGFTYDLGVGLRWDIAPAYSLRLGYEKHWYDLDEATSTPDLDQFKLGFIYRY